MRNNLNLLMNFFRGGLRSLSLSIDRHQKKTKMFDVEVERSTHAYECLRLKQPVA